MKKRILLHPSFSMRSYSRSKWLLTRDAHATQAMAICRQLCDTYDIDVHVPSNHDLEPDMFLGCRLLNDYDYGQHIVEQRSKKSGWPFSADGYDFILNGHLEHAKALRELYPEAKIATILAHGPLVENRGYLRENEDNCRASDVLFYNFSRNLLPESFKLQNTFKLFHLLGYADYNVIERRPAPTKTPGTILFLSRLTDPTRYKIDFWMSQLERLAKKYDVTLTDPSEGSSPVPKGTKKVVQKSKAHYFDMLRETETVIIPYSIERTYSVSYFEALAKGCKVITLKCDDHFRHLNTAYSLPGDYSEPDIDNALEQPSNPQTLHYADRYYIERHWCRKFRESFIDSPRGGSYLC